MIKGLFSKTSPPDRLGIKFDNFEPKHISICSIMLELASGVYIRHEKLRHEINREITFLLADLDPELKKKIVNSGFYYEKNYELIICFSCNFYLRNFTKYFTIKTNFFEIHKFYSPDCDFIKGDDVSILKTSKTNFCTYSHFMPQEKQKKWCESIQPTVFKFISDSFDLLVDRDTCVVKKENTQEPFPLFAVNEPIELPNALGTSVKFRVNEFFCCMRSAQRRYQTYKWKNNMFPFNGLPILELVKSGFFYCLYGTVIQCFACRLIVGNLNPVIRKLQDIHQDESPWCPHFNGRNGIDFPDLEMKPRLESVGQITENTEVQCKICLTLKIDVIAQCGHPMCIPCSDELNICPFCRQDIRCKQRIYWQ